MNSSIFYHAYLDDHLHWASILTEQMHEIISSGLGEKLVTFDMTIIGFPDQIELYEKLIAYYQPMISAEIYVNKLVKDYDDTKLPLMNVDPNSSGITFYNENETMHRIWDYCQKLDHYENIMFLHNKGITHVERVLKTGHVEMYANVQAWRQYLNYFNIECHSKCINYIESNEYDIVGSAITNTPYKFYSGGVWWARSDYIKKLPDPKQPEWWKPFEKQVIDLFETIGERYYDSPLMDEESKQVLKTNGRLDRFPIRYSSEAWVCSHPEVNAFSLHNPKSIDFYSYLCLKRDYLDNTLVAGSI